MTWRESEHPRNPHTGEFTDKPGGGWAQQLAAQMVPGGQSVTSEALDLDYAQLRRMVDAHLDDYEMPDEALGTIYEARGYHAKPAVVSRDEMDKLIADGWTQVWRGVGGKYVSSESQMGRVTEWAEGFRSGDEHRPGLGLHGNGTYTASFLGEAVDYTPWGGGGARPGVYKRGSYTFDHGDWPGLLRIAIRPDARVISSEELLTIRARRFDERRAQIAAERGVPVDEVDVNDLADDEYWVHADAGRLAAILGYDAIRVRSGNQGAPYYVVLNRGAVAVQEAVSGGTYDLWHHE